MEGFDKSSASIIRSEINITYHYIYLRRKKWLSCIIDQIQPAVSKSIRIWSRVRSVSIVTSGSRSRNLGSITKILTRCVHGIFFYWGDGGVNRLESESHNLSPSISSIRNADIFRPLTHMSECSRALLSTRIHSRFEARSSCLSVCPYGKTLLPLDGF
jgi:hypothetical protein